jgi:adenine-specific DNA-methyltransferase
MRDPSIFERPKILTRQTADEIIAAYDGNNYYYANTLHGTTVFDEAYHPLYVVGVLNSKIITWYYRSNTDEEGKVFAQIKIELLRKLPIPKATKSQQGIIIDLVKIIMSEREHYPSVDTTTIMLRINQLVYQFYELIPEEIVVVEGKAKA